MNNRILLKLTMADRVREFCRAHPFDNAGHTAAVEGLESALTRAETLMQQQRAGKLDASSSVANKAALRKVLHHHLRLLVRLADRADEDEPGVLEKFKVPKRLMNHKQYLAEARVAVNNAIARKDRLFKYGLTDADLDVVARAIDKFEAEVQAQNIARGSRVGARHDLARPSRTHY